MIIAAPQVLTPDGIVADVAVVVESGRIAEVGAAERPDVRLPDGILAPGLIDLQVNGCFGIDFADAAVDGWNLAARRLAETGVTAFLPTLITAPLEELVAGLRRSAAVDGHGARVLGVHVEGPFLAPSRRGAHDADLFCDPTPERIDALLEPGTLALLTLAPERAGALEAVERLAGAGVVVSVGHSDATADVVMAAADAGARMVTHLFNAQRGIHHREPGVAGAGLADGRLVCGLILDGHHVADAVACIAFAAAAGRIALVTDAIAAARHAARDVRARRRAGDRARRRAAAAAGRHDRRRLPPARRRGRPRGIARRAPGGRDRGREPRPGRRARPRRSGAHRAGRAGRPRVARPRLPGAGDLDRR